MQVKERHTVIGEVTTEGRKCRENTQLERRQSRGGRRKRKKKKEKKTLKKTDTQRTGEKDCQDVVSN